MYTPLVRFTNLVMAATRVAPKLHTLRDSHIIYHAGIETKMENIPINRHIPLRISRDNHHSLGVGFEPDDDIPVRGNGMGNKRLLVILSLLT